MRNLFSFFSKKTRQLDESTTLLDDQSTVITVSEKKHSLVKIEDGNVDEIILQYFASTLDDYIRFQSISKFHASIVKTYIPFSLPIIKSIFLKPDVPVCFKRGLKIAELECGNAIANKIIISSKDVDNNTLNTLRKMKGELNFKFKILKLASMDYMVMSSCLLILSALFLFLYFFYMETNLFKHPNDIFKCNSLIPDQQGNIEAGESRHAEAWLKRNNVSINNTDDLIAFCDMAKQLYCNNRVTADTSKKGVFNLQENLFIYCTNAPSALGGTGIILFALSVLATFAKVTCALKKYYSLDEEKEESRMDGVAFR